MYSYTGGTREVHSVLLHQCTKKYTGVLVKKKYIRGTLGYTGVPLFWCSFWGIECMKEKKYTSVLLVKEKSTLCTPDFFVT